MADSMWESFKAGYNESRPVISGQCKLINGFQAAPSHFYKMIEVALKNRKIPNLKTSRVHYKEGWVLSDSREYLRIVRGKITFEICGAPFGTGFFVSTRMIEFPESKGPLARLFRLFFAPNTYYKLDTAAMYRIAIEEIVSEVTEQLVNSRGDEEYTPVLIDKRASAKA